MELLRDAADPRGIGGLVQALDKKPPALMAVACHNLATQHEFLDQRDEALAMYRQVGEP
jgi:hypothetical protein